MSGPFEATVEDVCSAMFEESVVELRVVRRVVRIYVGDQWCSLIGDKALVPLQSYLGNVIVT